ncbi:ABC transporter permease [Clostridiales bacterium COT073_COT-073]|nr:ABC transporter permease [Clostridiales bacterium COT073_COT-073]
MKGNFFYVQLAKSNIKRNERNFIPFWLSCMIVVAFFFNMLNLKQIVEHSEDVYGNTTVASFLGFGGVIVGILAAIFVFYANSFLMKNRKKELGLYGILGLEKRHVALMLLIENLFIAGSSIISGLLLGMAFGKLLFLAMAKLIQYAVNMPFTIYTGPIWWTIAVFAVLFLLVLVFNLITMHLTEPVELLKSKNHGEKQPRFLRLTAMAGFFCIGAGYYIAITTTNPLKAILMFFFAVLLVIVGTHYLFTAGSVVFLKMLKKNQKFYYRPTNFISTSSLIYRMRKNATGLANICVLSCMVIVTVSTTATVYGSMEKALDKRFPRDYQMEWTLREEKDRLKIYQSLLGKYADQAGVTITDEYSTRSLGFMTMPINDVLVRDANEFNTMDAMGLDGFLWVNVYPAQDFSVIFEEEIDISLAKDEVIVSENPVVNNRQILNIAGKEYRIKKIVPMKEIKGLEEANVLDDLLQIVVFVADIEEVFELQKQDQENPHASTPEESLYFNIKGNKENIATFDRLVMATRNNENEDERLRLDSKEWNRAEYYGFTGGLYFIGIFLGSLFLLLTVLIIYFKQMSEGEEDRERFQILMKVGLSHAEAKKVIHKQLVMMFFLPLVTAIIHVTVARFIIERLLLVGFGGNYGLLTPYLALTIVIFAVIYFTVYLWTSKTYYQIVNSGNGTH